LKGKIMNPAKSFDVSTSDQTGEIVPVPRISEGLARACDEIAAMLAADSSTQAAVDLFPWIYVRIAHRFQQIRMAAREQASAEASVRCSGENGGVPGTEVSPTSKQPERPHPLPPTPAIREWARQLFGEEEVIAGLREIRETGGHELRDFVHELEQPADRP
jgi:hypothetical protein